MDERVVKDLAVTCKANISVLERVGWCHYVLDLAVGLDHLPTVDYILQNSSIYNEKLAAEILLVVNNIK